jgi:hypothetical protein
MALYRDPLQAATATRLLFGFRKIAKLAVTPAGLWYKISVGLWLAQGSATPCAVPAAIGLGYGWNYQGVQEEDGRSEDE